MELTKKQKAIMDGLFEADKDEDMVLADNNVSRRVFDTWLTEDAWVREFDRRIEESRRRTQIIVTKFQPSAAIKLVELTDCEKEDVARKACLDIIQMPRVVKESGLPVGGDILEVSDKTAEEILGLMVKDAKRIRDKKTEPH